MAIFHAEFFSKCLMRLVDVDICLPIEDLVEPQPQEGPFPTLYLLHGYTGRWIFIQYLCWSGTGGADPCRVSAVPG